MKKYLNKYFSIIVLSTICLSGCDNNLQYDYDDILLDQNSYVLDLQIDSLDKELEVVSKLEDYLLNNNLLDIPVYGEVNYTKFSDRVKIPTSIKYDENNNPIKIKETVQHIDIPNYGYGIIEEGTLEGKLDNVNDDKSHYLRKFGYDEYSEISNLTKSALFQKRLNEDKNNYEWYPSLASNNNLVNGNPRPLPTDKNGKVITDANDYTLSKYYKVYVRTDEISYSTLSLRDKIQKFNNRSVNIEDYLFSFERSLVSSSLDTKIKNAINYSNGLVQFEDVGIKSGNDINGTYLFVEFEKYLNPYEAMINISKKDFSPIPKEFLEIFTSKEDNNDSIIYNRVDQSLSIGPYILESEKKGEYITIKRNDTLPSEVKGGEHRYTIPGIYYITNNNGMTHYELFEQGKIDYAPLIFQEANNDKTGYLQGRVEHIYKLMVNSCNQDEWNYLYGNNGIYSKYYDEPWETKPILKNDNFIKGLSNAIDRYKATSNVNGIPTLQHFTDDTMVSHGIIYNDTLQHKKVMSDYYGENINNYYDKEKAIEYFKSACNELLNSGVYKEGDVIKLDVFCPSESFYEFTQNLTNGVEEIFNDSLVCNNKLTIEFTTSFSPIWVNVAERGLFDLSWGNTTSSLKEALLEHVNENQSGYVSIGKNLYETADIEYNSRMYTYESLVKAYDNQVLVDSNGKHVKHPYNAKIVDDFDDEQGNKTIVIAYDTINNSDVKTQLKSIELWYYESDSKEGYEYIELPKDSYKIKGNIITLQIESSQVEQYNGQVSFDLIFETNVVDNTKEGYSYLALMSNFKDEEKEIV